MRSPVSCAVISTLASIASLTACSPKLPDAYGVYVFDHGTYTPLSSAATVPPPATSNDATVLLFDKSLANMPIADLAKSVHRRYPVRVGIEGGYAPDAPYHFYKPTVAYVWDVTSEEESKPGSIKTGPVHGEPDMVTLSRAGGFGPGGHILLLPTGNYPFGKALPGDCQDEYMMVRESTGLQGFLDVGRPRAPDGAVIEKTVYVSCAITAKFPQFSNAIIETFLRTHQ